MPYAAARAIQLKLENDALKARIAELEMDRGRLRLIERIAFDQLDSNIRTVQGTSDALGRIHQIATEAT